MRQRLVAQGPIRATELSALLDELRGHLDDARTLVVSHLFFQVWGHKPATG